MGHLETSIRSHLKDYLAGQSSFADFSAWMYSTIWNIDQHGEPRATELAHSIMLALAEYDSGVLTLPEFEQELRAAALEGLNTSSARGSAAAAS